MLLKFCQFVKSKSQVTSVNVKMMSQVSVKKTTSPVSCGGTSRHQSVSWSVPWTAPSTLSHTSEVVTVSLMWESGVLESRRRTVTVMMRKRHGGAGRSTTKPTAADIFTERKAISKGEVAGRLEVLGFTLLEGVAPRMNSHGVDPL